MEYTENTRVLYGIYCVVMPGSAEFIKGWRKTLGFSPVLRHIFLQNNLETIMPFPKVFSEFLDNLVHGSV